MHSYFTTGTFGSNLSKFTNEIILMDLYKTLVNILRMKFPTDLLPRSRPSAINKEFLKYTAIK